MKKTRDYHQTRNIASQFLSIEKELKVDYINVPKVSKFNQIATIKFEDLKVIKLSKDQIKRYQEKSKIIVGESELFELVIINNSLNLVNKKTFEYRRVA